jgi:hypothetical protein
MFMVGQRVSQALNDNGELPATVRAIDPIVAAELIVFRKRR